MWYCKIRGRGEYKMNANTIARSNEKEKIVNYSETIKK